MKTRLIATSLFLAAFLVGCQEKENSMESVQPIKVKTMSVATECIVPIGDYSGTIEEENGTLLSFSSTGTVQKLYVHLGQRVVAGQLIATLDSTSMQNSYIAARATLEQAEDAYQRMKELHDKGSLPDIKWVEVQSRVEQARSMEQIAAKTLRDCKLYAPFSGVIAEKNVEVGQNVMPGTPIVRLVMASKLKVKISVPETEIASCFIGQVAIVSVPALFGQTFTAQIIEKGIVAQPLSRSYDVKLRVNDVHDDLLPGMVVKVSLLASDNEEMCVVPANIVQIDELNRTFVWVDNNGKAEKRAIICGNFVNDGVVVKQGLSKGEHILVEGQHKVCNGTIVEAVAEGE